MRIQAQWDHEAETGEEFVTHKATLLVFTNLHNGSRRVRRNPATREPNGTFLLAGASDAATPFRGNVLHSI